MDVSEQLTAEIGRVSKYLPFDVFKRYSTRMVEEISDSIVAERAKAYVHIVNGGKTSLEKGFDSNRNNFV